MTRKHWFLVERGCSILAALVLSGSGCASQRYLVSAADREAARAVPASDRRTTAVPATDGRNEMRWLILSQLDGGRLDPGWSPAGVTVTASDPRVATGGILLGLGAAQTALCGWLFGEGLASHAADGALPLFLATVVTGIAQVAVGASLVGVGEAHRRGAGGRARPQEVEGGRPGWRYLGTPH